METEGLIKPATD